MDIREVHREADPRTRRMCSAALLLMAVVALLACSETKEKPLTIRATSLDERTAAPIPPPPVPFEPGQPTGITLSRDWFGDYWQGDFGVQLTRLSLGPSGQASYHRSSGCFGEDSNIGRVASFDDGVIAIEWMRERRNDAPAWLSDRFYAVKWGEYRCLVPEHLMREFCNHVNLGYGPAHGGGAFVVRSAPRAIGPFTLPEVPEQFRDMLLTHQVRAAVISAEEIASTASGPEHRFVRKQFRVRLNAGADQGLQGGMAMRLAAPISGMTAIIQNVGEHECEAEISVPAFVQQMGRPMPKPGWELVAGGVAAWE
ncbi:MAG TPA: hypothetical protein VG797_06155 [Phycisphaerales bacterium]|nr:hypothetical protein [Phycisphaerales bacterium]